MSLTVADDESFAEFVTISESPITGQSEFVLEISSIALTEVFGPSAAASYILNVVVIDEADESVTIEPDQAFTKTELVVNLIFDRAAYDALQAAK